MDEGKLYGRGIAFPPQLGPDRRWSWSVGPDNVRESIRIILLTEARERLMLPEFGGGLKQFLFEPNTASTRRLIEEAVTQSLSRWEPRINLEEVVVEADPDDPQAALVDLRYQLVASQTMDEIRLRVPLAT